MGITNRFCFFPTYTAKCPFGTSTDLQVAWLAENDDVLRITGNWFEDPSNYIYTTSCVLKQHQSFTYPQVLQVLEKLNYFLLLKRQWLSAYQVLEKQQRAMMSQKAILQFMLEIK
ncbi:uncharacterized protein DS421_3g71420 [Arachis hypogaea]|nr:uncharacterized protein DS421_3g71420 [Arachis hypogaea]